MNEPGRWTLSDLEELVNNHRGPVLEELMKIAKLMVEEQSSNFILGKVIITNDTLDDED